MNFKNIFRALKNKEMLKRIGIVVFIIIVYRYHPFVILQPFRQRDLQQRLW